MHAMNRNLVVCVCINVNARMTVSIKSMMRNFLPPNKLLPCFRQYSFTDNNYKMWKSIKNIKSIKKLRNLSLNNNKFK